MHKKDILDHMRSPGDNYPFLNIPENKFLDCWWVGKVVCRHITTKLRNYRESGPCPVLWIPNITENTASWSKNMYIVIVVMFAGDVCDVCWWWWLWLWQWWLWSKHRSVGSGSPSLLDRMLVGPWSERRGTMRKTKYFIFRGCCCSCQWIMSESRR